MSTSTTCQVYWVSLSYVVTGHNSISAKCDSSLTSCTLYNSQGQAVLHVNCNSQLGQTGSTNPDMVDYFCACGNHAVSVPDIVDCGSICFNFSEHKPSCNYLSLRFGYTSGDSSNGVTEDVCEAMDCVAGSTRCTTDGSTEYICDNLEHEPKYLGGSSTYSYVCNCNGPATIPSVYGSGFGKACKNVASTAATVSSNAVSTAISSAKPTTSSAGRVRRWKNKALLLSIIGLVHVIMLV